MRNILQFDFFAPEGFKGWGCVVCDLAPRGAVAVLCDACAATDAEPRFIMAGSWSTEGKRQALEGFERVPFGHNPEAHPELAERKVAALRGDYDRMLSIDLTKGCPDCASNLFNPGPRGCAAMNVRCAQCGAFFWWSPPFPTRRIESDEQFFDLATKAPLSTFGAGVDAWRAEPTDTAPPSMYEQVYAIARECLVGRGEVGVENAVIVEAVAYRYAFHPEPLARHRAAIAALCNRLADGFQKSSKGGGWTFLNLCVTKDGEPWGKHRDGEMLLALAMGAGLAGILDPRDKWDERPGRVPYVYFDTVEFRD